MSTNPSNFISKYDSPLKELYERLGIFNRSLQDHCFNCENCWKAAQEGKWNRDDIEECIDEHGTDPTHIYLPWIGPRYEETRLLALGINMNQFGGLNSLRELVSPWVKKDLADGKTRILKNDNYSGTFYWHRVPSYVLALLERDGIVQPEWTDSGFPNAADLANALDYFAITNSIKCAPRWHKSKPTADMWQHCPGEILREELRILLPKKLLILGHTDNYYYFNAQVLDKGTNKLDIDKGYLKKGSGKIDGREVEFFVIVHPTARGGNSHALMRELRELPG